MRKGNWSIGNIEQGNACKNCICCKNANAAGAVEGGLTGSK